MDITVYTTPGCPRCKVLKTKLEQKNIEYTESSNVDEVIALGFSSAPVVKINGIAYDYKGALEWIKTLP